MFLPDPTGKKKSIGMKLLWLLVVALLVAAGFAARPLYHKLKKQRATSMAASAEQLMEQERWQEAFNKLQAALQMDPLDMRANRAMARLLTLSRKEEAFRFWNIVFTQGSPTPEDRIEVIELALALKRLDIAERFLTEALKETPPPTAALRAAAFLGDAKGDSSMAIKFARFTLRQQTNDPQVQFLLARHLYRANNPESNEEAKQLLWSILKAHPDNSLPVIQTLAGAPNLHRNELQELLGIVNKQANATNGLELLKVDLAARLEPAKKDEMLASILDKAHSSPEQLLRTVRYLNQRREFEATIKLVKRAQALESRDLFLAYTDALAAVGYWLELQEIFQIAQLPIEPVLVELYRARIATELKDPAKANKHWEQVHWRAGDQPEPLLYVAEYAEKIGELNQAARAYRQLTKDPRHARSAFTSLIRITERQGDTAALKELVKTMVELYPNDPAPKNDLAYLNLLMNQEVGSSLQVAEQLVRDNPHLLAYRTTLALGYLRSGQNAKAKETYTGISFEWGSALPGWQAVYVGVMGAAGETGLLRQLARSIPFDRLKPQERELVKPWL
ncbi:MAG TPA: hypothetical protein VEH27_17385 [Methylomirabilota bacterium]|nr:hypothetical protein [Methylomirabilota bacterium]